MTKTTKLTLLLTTILVLGILSIPIAPKIVEHRISESSIHGMSVNNSRFLQPHLLSTVVSSASFGGDSIDYCTDMTIDDFGNVYLTGYTNSQNFPQQGYGDTAVIAGYDCFVMKFNPTCDVLIYSAIIRGSGSDEPSAIDVDSQGNAYVVGETTSTDFPTTNAFDDSFNGGSDGFLFKLNPEGDTLLYSTYIGGSNYDSAEALLVESSDTVLISGYTNSYEFPVTEGAFDETYNAVGDGFILKIDINSNVLIFSSFFGGFGWDSLYCIAQDSVGDIYVAGRTTSRDLPTTAGAYDRTYNGGSYDCIAFKMNGNGSSLIYSTYYGGSSWDYITSIQVDSSGNAYLFGATYSSDFPTKNGYDDSLGGNCDAYVLKLNRYGNSIEFSTFVGGSSYDFGCGFSLGSSGSIVITGETKSDDFPITTGAISKSMNGPSDIYVLMLNSSGREILYSTYFGGSYYEDPYAVVLDSDGNAIVTGETESSDFPLEEGYSDLSKGGRDCFLIRIPDLTDSDGDMLTDEEEVTLGTNINNIDTDADTYSDYWEYQNGFDPTDPIVPLSEPILYYMPLAAPVSLILIISMLILFRKQIIMSYRLIWPQNRRVLLYECPSCHMKFEAPVSGVGSRKRKCPECGTLAKKENQIQYIDENSHDS